VQVPILTGVLVAPALTVLAGGTQDIVGIMVQLIHHAQRCAAVTGAFTTAHVIGLMIRPTAARVCIGTAQARIAATHLRARLLLAQSAMHIGTITTTAHTQAAKTDNARAIINAHDTQRIQNGYFLAQPSTLNP